MWRHGGELIGLDVEAGKTARGWIDLQAAEAHVLGKGAKRRTVPVGKTALAALEEELGWHLECLKLAKGMAPSKLREARVSDLELYVGAKSGLCAHSPSDCKRHSRARHTWQGS